MSAPARVFQAESRVIAIPSDRCTEIMLEMLELGPDDVLMEIGTGSGTQTEAFASCCKEVHSIELKPVCDPSRLGNSVYLVAGDGRRGIPESAPFHAIVCTCGVSDLPRAWSDQLAEGGRMVVPVGTADSQKLTKFVKRNGILEAERIGAYVRFMMME